MIKTLCSLLFIVLLFGSSHAWMDPLYITPQIIEDPRPRIPLNTSSDNYRPIQITFDTSNAYYPEKLQYLNDYIFPQVKNYLKAALKVLPRSSRVFPTAGICGDKIKIPSDASETGYDTDIVIYVRIYNEQTYKNYFNFSKGAACGLDETTGRPIVGALMFDSVFDGHPYQNGELERRVGEVIRELVHVLGFRDTLFPYYINPETFQPLTGHFFNKTVNDFNTLVLNVAPLTQKVRDYFSCPTAEGAYLENQGDNLTMNSYFERRVFGNELMTAGDKADKRISQFTLALLEGTGWYKANYDLAEPMTWGKNQGCAFLDTKCVDPVTLKPNFKEFCFGLTSQFPSWTKRGIAFCGITVPKKAKTDPDLPAAFDYWGNKTIVFDEYSDNCPTDYLHYRTAELHASPDYDCENPDTVEDCTLREEEIRGFGSKVFMGNLTRRRWTKAEYNGSCFKPNCVLQIDGRYELQVNFGNGGVVTCSEAGWINSTKFNFKHELVGGLECPDPNEFCGQILAEGSCKGQCYGNGVCANRRCQCKEGWGYRTCLEKTEFPRSGRCTEDPLRTTAYGDDCICSKYNNTCQCALGLKTGDICKKKPTKLDL